MKKNTLAEKLIILIHENEGAFKDSESLADFINDYMYADKTTLEDIRDCIGEWADGVVPIYYSAIMETWRDNGEAHGMTLEVLGEADTSGDVYKLMQSDLYFYYDQEMNEDFQTLEDLASELIEKHEEEEAEKFENKLDEIHANV